MILSRCRLCREVKDLVREKKLAVWNGVVERVSGDFEGSKETVWAFVGRKLRN